MMKKNKLQFQIFSDRSVNRNMIFRFSFLWLLFFPIACAVIIEYIHVHRLYLALALVIGSVIHYVIQFLPHVFVYKKEGEILLTKNGVKITREEKEQIIPISNLKKVSVEFNGISKWTGSRNYFNHICEDNSIMIVTQADEISVRFLVKEKKKYLVMKSYLKALQSYGVEVKFSGAKYKDL